MRIRLVLIPHDDVSRIRPLIDTLRDASNAGDMDAMDAATLNLMAVTADMKSIELSEKEWRGFMAGIRAGNSAFQSDYLVPAESCSQYFPHAISAMMVLQLPVDEREGDDV